MTIKAKEVSKTGSETDKSDGKTDFPVIATKQKNQYSYHYKTGQDVFGFVKEAKKIPHKTRQLTGRQWQMRETNYNTNVQWCKGYSMCENLQ